MSEQHRQSTHKKAVSGIKWALSGSVGLRGFQFAFGILLANLLLPEHFGIIAMIYVFSGLAQTFHNFGFASALLHRKDCDEGHFQSVFWFNSIVSVLIYALLFACAPAIAGFYEHPEIVTPIRVMTLVLVLQGLQAVPTTILYKQMRFKAVTTVQFIGLFVGSGTAVVMAFSGYGVWSLITEQLLTVAVALVGVYLSARWRPKFIFSIGKLRELLSFGINIFFSSLLLQFGRNIDNLLIAKFMGGTAVGLYSKAYACMQMATLTIVTALAQVMAPMLIELQDDLPAVRHYFMRILGLGYLLVAPPMLILAVVSHDFVSALYGEKWVAMVPVLQVMTLVAIVRVFERLCRQLLLTRGRSGYVLTINIMTVSVNTIGIVCGLPWGLIGISIGLLISDCLLVIPVAWLTLPRVELKPWQIVRAISGVLGCALLMALGMLAVQALLPATWPLPPVGLPDFVARRWPHMINVMLLSTCGIGLITALLWLFRVDVFRSALQLLRKRKSGSSFKESLGN